MEDLGPPQSYLTVEPGLPVYSADGSKVGRVERVVADFVNDIFEGLVVDVSPLPGGHRFADAEQVDEIHERGIVLGVSAEEAKRLPKAAEVLG